MNRKPRRSERPARPMVEYRFKIDSYTPDTIPMARLAEYLEELATLLGERQSVHFIALEDGSTVPVVGIEREAVPKVEQRVRDVKLNEGPDDARRARRALNDKLIYDNGSGVLIGPTGHKLLIFPGRKEAAEPVYGPFNQPGVFDGVPIVIGGKLDRVPVHIQDNGDVYLCEASREVAKGLAPFLFTTCVRVKGTGRWYRDKDGTWEMRNFAIDSFSEVKADGLSAAVDRLRQIPARWKERPDALGDLKDIRHDSSDADTEAEPKP